MIRSSPFTVAVNSRKLCFLVKNMIFTQSFSRLKCSAFYWECVTEIRLQILTLVKAIHIFKTIAIGVKFV